MPTLIKQFPDGSRVEYDRGTFDDWCVWVSPIDKSRFAPLDTEYFGRFREIGRVHTHEKIYNDFVTLYQSTGKRIELAALELIDKLSSGYGQHSQEMSILLTVVYAGMVAEENKAGTRLGKRIKRLGMYQALVEGSPAEYAANFSRGKRWQEIDLICKQKGF